MLAKHMNASRSSWAYTCYLFQLHHVVTTMCVALYPSCIVASLGSAAQVITTCSWLSLSVLFSFQEIALKVPLSVIMAPCVSFKSQYAITSETAKTAPTRTDYLAVGVLYQRFHLTHHHVAQGTSSLLKIYPSQLRHVLRQLRAYRRSHW